MLYSNLSDSIKSTFEYYKYKYFILLLFFSIFILEIIFFCKKQKISIFLPIYNQEKYINKCILLLQRQTLKDIEIVAVNDYSNDTTLNKLINLSANDNRIKIVNNNKNHGLLYSRAMGILNSNGEYIMNLDPDDELAGEDNLEYLYNLTKIYHTDIITFEVFNKRKNRTISKCFKNLIIEHQPNVFISIFGKTNRIKDYYIWNKLIKREIFLKAYEYLKNEIYNGKWNYFEDDIWNILVNKYAKTKLCTNKLIYIYNYNNNSLISNRNDKIEFQNLLYRHEMYKKIFNSKDNIKYLIGEYIFLLNRLKKQKKYILLINDTHINQQIINNFHNFLNTYNSSKNIEKKIFNFLESFKI